MRAATYSGVGLPLEITTVDMPAVAPGSAILRVGACGICGSDIHASGTEGMLSPGAILGHEFAGEIVELGPDPIGDWAVGDRVFSMANYSCGHCGPCRTGRSHFCDQIAHIGHLLEGDLPGAYAEHARVSTNDLVRLPEQISDDVGALLEPLCTAMVSVRIAELPAGARVLILGGGPIGLAIAQICRLLGARHIVLSEPVDQRRMLAEQLGATDTLNPVTTTDTVSAYQDITGAEPDVVFEAIGKPGFLDVAVAHVKTQGTVIAAGVCMEPDPFNHLAAYVKEPTIRIPCYYTLEDAQYLVDMLDQGRLDPAPMITHRVSLDGLPEAFEALRTPTDQVKVIVEP